MKPSKNGWKRKMANRWKTFEYEYLAGHAEDGAEAIARRIGRSRSAVSNMASRLGISLRKYWKCPNCGCEVPTPLSPRTGWCRACSLRDSRDRAAIHNREARLRLQAEERKVKQLERERQNLYSDTNKKLSRFRELRETEENLQVRKEKR